jgi:prepilin-type processing-associated H-X9-DG protein
MNGTPLMTSMICVFANDVLSGGRARGESVAISADEAPDCEERSELSAFDARSAPQLAQRIGLELLEENVRTELLVRLVLRGHGGRTSQVLFVDGALRIPRRQRAAAR